LPINDILSICIPTYNRAEILRGCLESIIPQARKHEIPIYISDNASTDNTAEVASVAHKKYPHIYYSRNPNNFGAEKNKACALKMSKSKYVWLCGDRVRVVEGAIDKILRKLNEEYFDLMVVNCYARPPRVMVKDIIESTLYTDQDKLLGDLGWWITFVGASIWNSDMIKNGKFDKYEHTDFVHIGVIFEYLANKNVRIYWDAKPLIYSAGESGWYNKTFEIFAKNWFELIQSLPAPYTEGTKRKCIKDLNVKNNNFTLRGIIQFRSLGYYDLNIYNMYKSYFKYVTNVPQFFLFLIAFMPPVPAVIIDFFRKIKNSLNPRMS
jgi:glycosyltransferase involved in cell wall biosynthesis